MTDRITATLEQLAEDTASMTACHLRVAVREIDDLFGDGYAEDRPDLVAAYLLSASSCMAASIQAKYLDTAMRYLADSIVDSQRQ